MERPRTESEAIALFVSELPELEVLQAEHLKTFDELLPYLLLADFVRWYEHAVREARTDLIRRFLAVVELLLTTDAEPPASDPVWNLMGVSFTESTHDYQWAVAQSSRWIGPRTRKMLQIVGGGASAA